VYCILQNLVIKPTNAFYWAIKSSCLQCASYMFRPARFVIMPLGSERVEVL